MGSAAGGERGKVGRKGWAGAALLFPTDGMYDNKAGYTAQDAPSTRLKKTRDRRTYGRTYGRTDGRTDGHDLL